MSLDDGTTKTVLELDLVSYSDIARILEENLNVQAVKTFQDQIQTFVDDGLRVLGLHRDDVVFGTAGDNALLFFEDAATAHRFSEAIQKASADYNCRRGVESAKRWFRIGAATGAVLVLAAERRIVGTTVARAVRLEAAASKGQLVIDTQTFNALPDELKRCYGAAEIVCGKRDERFTARRCTFVESEDELDAMQDRVARTWSASRSSAMSASGQRAADKCPESGVVTSGPILEIASGPEEGTVFRLTKDRVVLGRADECDICLKANISASRYHAQLVRTERGYLIECLRAPNGLYIRGRQIIGREPLEDGDLICIGSAVLIYRSAEPLYGLENQ